MKTCEGCEGRVTRTRKQEVLVVSGRRFVVSLPARACRSCGVQADAASLERIELEVACELAREGPASGETFRFMRKALGMRAMDLADLLGITPETVSRWENGQRLVDRSAWIALGSMVLEKARRSTATVQRLRTFKNPPAGTRSIRIVLGRSG